MGSREVISHIPITVRRTPSLYTHKAPHILRVFISYVLITILITPPLPLIADVIHKRSLGLMHPIKIIEIQNHVFGPKKTIRFREILKQKEDPISNTCHMQGTLPWGGCWGGGRCWCQVTFLCRPIDHGPFHPEEVPSPYVLGTNTFLHQSKLNYKNINSAFHIMLTL